MKTLNELKKELEQAGEKTQQKMTDINLWWHRGQKVKIISPYFEGRTGTILQYHWLWSGYLVVMDDWRAVLLFKKSELEELQETQ